MFSPTIMCAVSLVKLIFTSMINKSILTFLHEHSGEKAFVPQVNTSPSYTIKTRTKLWQRFCQNKEINMQKYIKCFLSYQAKYSMNGWNVWEVFNRIHWSVFIKAYKIVVLVFMEAGNQKEVEVSQKSDEISQTLCSSLIAHWLSWWWLNKC